ncbi:MAG: chromosome partitioning protein ParB [Myxococcales bacterium]|nr:chromosome partitioning protein ParB [Myxococcales bacterium]MCB9716107.1 chromosome partitioning protein ParB [Myxococcales bacterium]
MAQSKKTPNKSEDADEESAPKKRTPKKTAKKAGAKKSTRGKKAEPGSRGLRPDAVGPGELPAAVIELQQAIADDGGSVLATYLEPLGGHHTLLAALPVDKVEPTPFQRDLSAAHAKRLTGVIDKLDRFLDPIITVRAPSGGYWTPNGNHRLTAVRELGGSTIIALVVPELEVAYKILALNTEKAHNVKEKALEVIRMARSLAELDAQPESAYALEFEEPSLLTLGACYESKGRFSGSAYAPVLKRIEAFLELPLAESIPQREARAAKLLALDEAVAAAVEALKAKGLDSPYLKAFVVARCNPLRFAKGDAPPWDEVIGSMTDKARRFDAGKVDAGQLAKAGGPAEG